VVKLYYPPVEVLVSQYNGALRNAPYEEGYPFMCCPLSGWEKDEESVP
jgi:hypothetical protein